MLIHIYYFVICGVNIILSEEQYRFLSLAQKKEKVSRRFKKITVMLMMHQGHSIESIQAALGLDDNTIRRYVKKYKDKGFERFVKDNYLKYQGKLRTEQLIELEKHLKLNLYIDSQSICDYVLDKYEIHYTVSGMTKLLHRLGFVYKQTKAVPSKADEAAQVEFLEETLPNLLEEVNQGEAVVYYADGCHPTHNTKTGRAWIKKGEEFPIHSNSGRSRVNINAAINACKPEHSVYDITDSVNAQSTKRLCQQLLKKHRKNTIYLICDNARYYKNKMLQNWIKNQRVKLIYLPPYSPNLNLIERLWRLMRKEIIHSIYYDTYSKFKEAITDFMENTKLYKEELRSLLTMNFRTVEGTSFHAQTKW